MKIRLLSLFIAAMACLTASAQEKLIDGYFRLQTSAGDYMSVTGPFTANANLSAAEAMAAPGSVFHITAVRDGDLYRLTNLSAQGVDLAKDEMPSSKYGDDFIWDIWGADDMLYGMVFEGYQYGYASVARATLATLFQMVAARLNNHGTSSDETDGFVAVARHFNENVVAKLDLGFRMKPLADGSMQIYVDMPDFQMAVDWYLEDEERKAEFTRAMDAMVDVLGGEDSYMLMFSPEDLDLLKRWGYDYLGAYPANKIEVDVEIDGEPVHLSGAKYNFPEVFSDKVLLFNWVKFMAYNLINPDADKYGRFKALVDQYLNGMNLGELLDRHTITRLINTQFESFKHDSRIYFVAGNVVNGVYNAENRHLGFAIGDKDLAQAGSYGTWKLTPMTGDDSFVKFELTGYANSKNYGAYFVDFPVKPLVGEATTLKTYTGENSSAYDTDDQEHHYTELVAVEKAAPLTPFVIESDKAEVTLSVDYETLFTRLDAVPDNSVIIGDDYTGQQHSPALRADEPPLSPSMRGVLLPTSADNLRSYWKLEDAPTVYAFGNIPAYTTATTAQTTEHVGFAETTTGLAANQAVYTPTAAHPDAQLYIDMPEFEKINVSAIEAIIADNAEQTVVYDLRGMRVTTPVAGQLYIINGKKVLAK